jgi:hypothetical protein
MVQGSGPNPGRILACFALVGPGVYLFAVLVGGALWPGYSQYGESISTLTSTGAPNQGLLLPLFAVYNLSLLALAVCLHAEVPPSRRGIVGPAFLAAAAVAGLILLAVPQGPWSDPLSGTGVAHTIIAGLDALCFLLALAFLAPRLRATPPWARFGSWTWGFLGLGVVAGGVGAAAVSLPFAGLAERLSIGVFLVWTQWAALAILRHGAIDPSERDRRAVTAVTRG